LALPKAVILEGVTDPVCDEAQNAPFPGMSRHGIEVLIGPARIAGCKSRLWLLNLEMRKLKPHIAGRASEKDGIVTETRTLLDVYCSNAYASRVHHRNGMALDSAMMITMKREII